MSAAVLLPFKNGKIDFKSYGKILDRLVRADKVIARIMARLFPGKKLKKARPIRLVIAADTSFNFQLLPDQRMQVIRYSLKRHKNAEFVIGLTNTGTHADEATPDHCLSLMRQIKEEFPRAKITFMIMQWRAMTALHGQDLIDLFAQFEGYRILLHELVPEFVPHGRLLTAFEFHGIASLPHVVECKVSALAGGFDVEQRIELVRQFNLNLRVKSGNDWDVQGAFMCAQGLLMGLIMACPALFLMCDLIDPADASIGWIFYNLLGVIQFAGFFMFKINANFPGADVASYKASLAQWLVLLGVIPSAEIHPDCPDKDRRPASDIETLKSILAMFRHVLKMAGLTEDEIHEVLC
jgi:hypothetical protein